MPFHQTLWCSIVQKLSDPAKGAGKQSVEDTANHFRDIERSRRDLAPFSPKHQALVNTDPCKVAIVVEPDGDPTGAESDADLRAGTNPSCKRLK